MGGRRIHAVTGDKRRETSWRLWNHLSSAMLIAQLDQETAAESSSLTENKAQITTDIGEVATASNDIACVYANLLGAS